MFVALVAEAGTDIGYGHFSELRAVQAALHERNIPNELCVIGSPCASPAWREAQWFKTTEELTGQLGTRNPNAVIFSFRGPVTNSLWRYLESDGVLKVSIIDQPCALPPIDLLIIATIVENDWGSSQPLSRVLRGPAYLPLFPCYQAAPKPTAERKGDVLLSLGGVDRTRATLRLLPSLQELDATVVIGPGFVHAREVRDMASHLGIKHEDAPGSLHELLAAHRTVITAGGNTLYEAAACGTPALVAWEDPHEMAQGNALEKHGSAIVLGQGVSLEPSYVSQRVRDLLDDSDGLELMAGRGRECVDGGGATRIVTEVLNQISNAKLC